MNSSEWEEIEALKSFDRSNPNDEYVRGIMCERSLRAVRTAGMFRSSAKERWANGDASSRE